MINNAIIVGCTKNSSQYLKEAFENIDNFSKIFSKVAYIIVENDSTDNTKNILNEWGSGKEDFTLLNLDGLDSYEKNRTIRLEIARNLYIDKIRKKTNINDFQYLIIIDIDDQAVYPVSITAMEKSLKFLKSKERYSAVFANQPNGYYDLWALRHPVYCPFDFWHEVLMESIKINNDSMAFSSIYSKINVNFSNQEQPIAVDSAFGGLGIYKIDHILKNKSRYIGYDYKYFDSSTANFCKLQTCEHVSFNHGLIAQGGELFIFPELINSLQKPYFNHMAHHTIIIK